MKTITMPKGRKTLKLNRRQKLLVAFVIILTFTVIAGAIGVSQISVVNNRSTTIVQDQLEEALNLTQTAHDMVSVRTKVLAHVLTSDPAKKDKIDADITALEKSINATLTRWQSKTDSPAGEIEGRNNLVKAWQAYQEAYQSKTLTSSRNGDTQKATEYALGEVGLLFQNVSDAIKTLENHHRMISKEILAQNQASFTLALWLIIGSTALAILVGWYYVTFLGSSLGLALKLMGNAAKDIAEQDLQSLLNAINSVAHGDLTTQVEVKAIDVKYKSSDDLGEMADSFNLMISRLRETGDVFSRMCLNLREMVGQVATNAQYVDESSEQMAVSANQTGLAVNQIATTMQQIANGAAQQSDSVTRTAHSVDQMARAIDGVAKGAQEQATAAGRASSITNQIGNEIQQVTANIRKVSENALIAADAARAGANIVESTLTGMNNIKSRVGLSAQKVEEMGNRSSEIGEIVETIEDIASQTNLLALNAAIEAARAGEHGKGFAVVADEVRKLAERSANSTKEIAALIKAIQTTVAEAVQAMNEGEKEVETGVTLANDSGKALEKILSAVDAVHTQSDQAASAAARMSESSNDLIAAVDSVSAIVEENTASTEQMSANSSDVTQSMENIASISEQNSAAVEEVSASAEEMSSQVEEVAIAANSLSDSAKSLKAVVARFKLNLN